MLIEITGKCKARGIRFIAKGSLVAISIACVSWDLNWPVSNILRVADYYQEKHAQREEKK